MPRGSLRQIDNVSLIKFSVVLGVGEDNPCNLVKTILDVAQLLQRVEQSFHLLRKFAENTTTAGLNEAKRSSLV